MHPVSIFAGSHKRQFQNPSLQIINILKDLFIAEASYRELLMLEEYRDFHVYSLITACLALHRLRMMLTARKRPAFINHNQAEITQLTKFTLDSFLSLQINEK